MGKKNENEIRQITTKLEVRQVGEGDNKTTHLQGYALTFNQMSEYLGFREIIAQGALDNCDMSNVVLNVNHDMDKPLARNIISQGIGSLTLSVDDKGLFFDATPTDTSYSRDLLANMAAGIINKCSFRFCLDWNDDTAQTWDWDDGKRGYDLRTINKIAEISDVSIVTCPAYESTSCQSYQRAKEQQNEETKKAKEARELKKKQIEIALELL